MRISSLIKPINYSNPQNNCPARKNNISNLSLPQEKAINDNRYYYPIINFKSTMEEHLYEGAKVINDSQTRFALNAPYAKEVSVLVKKLNGEEIKVPLEKTTKNRFEKVVNNVRAGDLYKYQVLTKDNKEFTDYDPRADFLPNDVGGFRKNSNWGQIIDHKSYKWTDDNWINKREEADSKSIFWNFPKDMIIEEIHIGVLGGFNKAKDEIDKIVKNGIANTVHLMPIGEFYGDMNWGYDEVAKYAVENAYGTPDEFKDFVNYAHNNNIRVILDVVPNHFGTMGSCAGKYGPMFKSDYSNWGGDLTDLAGENSDYGKSYMIDMLMNWAVNYHVDGFRFDATSVMGADEALIEINKDLRSHKETQSLILYPEDMRMLVEMANNTAGKEINKDNWGYNGLTTFDFFKAITSNVTGQQINDFKPHPKTLSKIFKKGVYKYKDEQKGLKDISYTTIFKLPTGKIDINGKEITEAKAVRRNLSEVSRMFPNNFLINVSNHDEIGNFPGGKRNMVSILATRLGIYDNRVKENRDTANSSSKASNLLFELVKNYAKTGMVLDESTQIKMGCMKPISQKEMDREFHNSFELNKVMLGTMFLHPSPKEFFMGDDLGELAPFKFFVNVPLGDAKFKKSIEKEKGYSVGKDTFDEAKLNTDKYNIKWVNDATLKFSQDFLKVLEQNATLKSRNFENISTHEHKDKNALEINYFDKNTGEEVVAVINFSDKAHINFPLYTISSSKVEELINSTSSEYGGENFYQNSKNSSSKNLEIPPHSIIVFKKN